MPAIFSPNLSCLDKTLTTVLYRYTLYIGLGRAVRTRSSLSFIRRRPTKPVVTSWWRQRRVSWVVWNWLPTELEFFPLEQLQAAPSAASLDARLLTELADHKGVDRGGHMASYGPSIMVNFLFQARRLYLHVTEVRPTVYKTWTVKFLLTKWLADKAYLNFDQYTLPF